MSDQVTEQRTCRFPGCDRPAAAGDAGTGRRPEYCDDPAHNRAAAWRERQRLKGAGQLITSSAGDEARPVEAARQKASELVAQLTGMAELFMDQLPRAIEEIRTAGDLDAAEAQIESVTTEAEERIAGAVARASRAEQAQRRAEAEREEADAAAIESTDAVTRLEEELVDVSAQADGFQNEASALQEELDATREAAAAAASESEAAIAVLRNELASLQIRLEERVAVVEGERDHLAEELDTAQAARAEAEERARGAVERAGAEATRADRAEQAATTAREQVDTARGQVDDLRDQIGELRAVEATARAERDAARAEGERERSHGEQRLADMRASFGEQFDELRSERTSLQTQVDQLRAAAAKPARTQRKTQSE